MYVCVCVFAFVQVLSWFKGENIYIVLESSSSSFSYCFFIWISWYYFFIWFLFVIFFFKKNKIFDINFSILNFFHLNTATSIENLNVQLTNNLIHLQLSPSSLAFHSFNRLFIYQIIKSSNLSIYFLLFFLLLLINFFLSSSSSFHFKKLTVHCLIDILIQPLYYLSDPIIIILIPFILLSLST